MAEPLPIRRLDPFAMRVVAFVLGFVVLVAILAFFVPSGVDTSRNAPPLDAPSSIGKAMRGLGFIALGLVAVAMLLARGGRGGGDQDG